MSRALECVTNGRAAAPPANVCNIGVSTSRNPRRSSAVAYRADNRDSLAGHRARLRANDQVDITLPHPRFFAHLLVRDGQRPQRLGGHLPGVGKDGQFAASRADHVAVHIDDVAEVDVGLPGVERILADLVQADHHLQLGAVAVLQCRKAQFSGVAREYHPARDADDVVCRGVDRQVRVGGAHLGQGVGAFDGDRVGVRPLANRRARLSRRIRNCSGRSASVSRRSRRSRRASLNDVRASSLR